ncbi:MAG TPA: DUF4198 domain-containing protein [Candidatus Acidoferrales bacterium]|nr:DUF4198 domain-containing protein [Candidatus Acidoferrales bacterium]
MILRARFAVQQVARGVVVLAAAAIARSAPAHEYWLSPSRFNVAPSETVTVAAFSGTGFRGEPRPWAPERCVRFVLAEAGNRDLAPLARRGAIEWARCVPSDEGGALLAYQSNWARIELPAGRFESYLAEEGLDDALAARRREQTTAPGRERYRRCCKAYLAGLDATRSTRVLGLPLEIVPRTRPGAGALMRVRVLWNGRPLAGALVHAWRSPFDTAGRPLDPATRDTVAACWSGRTDAAGGAAIPTREPGEWLLSVVHMQRCPQPDQADWESTWASLTFARPRARRAATP